jgi:pimeloyl-ACP methyl ester carboxylesterase
VSKVAHRHVSLPSQPPIGLHVAEAGAQDAPLLVLLHGFPDYWESWAGLIDPLAGRYRVVVPDQRGYNLSDKPRGLDAYAADALAGDVANLIALYGRRRALVVGHDWGGAVTWHLAATRPELVERFVIMNAPHPKALRRALRDDKEQRRRLGYMLLFQLPGLPEYLLGRRRFARLRKVVRQGIAPGAVSDEALERQVEAWSRPGALTAMLNWYRAAARRPPRNVPRTPLAPPGLVLWGENDPVLMPALARASVEECAHARLQLVPGAGHWVHRDRPDDVLKAMLAFFAEPAP